MIWIVPIFLLIVFEGLADVFSKHYSLKPTWYFWVLAIALYIIANIFWLSAIKNGSGLGRGSVIFSVGSAILGVLIGLILFNEQTSKFEIIGFALGILSLVFIFWE